MSDLAIHLVNAQIMCELLVAEHLFAHFLEKRPGYIVRLLLTGIVCVLLAFLFPLLPVHLTIAGSIMYISLFFISGAGICLCYAEDLWSILFCCITGYTIQHLSSTLHTLAGLFFPAVPDAVLYLVTLLLPYAVCYMIFSRDLRKLKKIVIDNKKLLLLSAAGLYVNIFFSLIIMTIKTANEQPVYEMMLHMSEGMIGILLLCIQFSLLSNRSLELELNTVSTMLQEKEKQYETSRENIDLINQKCHDLKHQIRTLRKKDEVIDKEALKEIEKAVEIYDTTVKTGNAALDVILTEKSLLCEKSGITLTCMAEGDTIGFMSPGDVYSLFGNAVDNAVEAVSRIDDPQKRSIGLNVKGRGNMVSVHVENYYEGTLRFEDGLPLTSKEDRNYHGFGMKSMQTIAEKYGGFMTASASDGIFRLDFVIPKKGSKN